MTDAHVLCETFGGGVCLVPPKFLYGRWPMASCVQCGGSTVTRLADDTYLHEGCWVAWSYPKAKERSAKGAYARRR